MTSSKRGAIRGERRRKFLIDNPLQLSVAFCVVGIITAVTFLFVLGVYVLPDEEFLDRMNGHEARNLLVAVNGIFFVLSVSILTCFAVLMTHRVAGPAMVIERALYATIDGDYSQRLSLRDKDYLKEVAVAAAAVRDHVQTTRSEHRELLEEIARQLDVGDAQAARELLRDVVPNESVAELETVGATTDRSSPGAS